MQRFLFFALAVAIGFGIGWLSHPNHDEPLAALDSGESVYVSRITPGEGVATYHFRPFMVKVGADKTRLSDPAPDAERWLISLADGRVEIYAVRVDSQ